jgi:NAD(P)H-dependent FMN reductase
MSLFRIENVQYIIITTEGKSHKFPSSWKVFLKLPTQAYSNDQVHEFGAAAFASPTYSGAYTGTFVQQYVVF